jgi:hypothetical protein
VGVAVVKTLGNKTSFQITGSTSAIASRAPSISFPLEFITHLAMSFDFPTETITPLSIATASAQGLLLSPVLILVFTIAKEQGVLEVNTCQKKNYADSLLIKTDPKKNKPKAAMIIRMATTQVPPLDARFKKFVSFRKSSSSFNEYLFLFRIVWFCVVLQNKDEKLAILVLAI